MLRKTFRRLPVVCSCCLALAGVLSAHCETVSSIEELTNALNQVSAARSKTNAVITLTANEYKLGSIAKMHESAMLSVSNGIGGSVITIQGDPECSRETIVLDAEHAGRVLRIFGWSNSTTILKNLTIRNGQTVSPGNNGGVVIENWGKFKFENCIFEGNQAYNYSAAVGGTNADKFFKDCLFIRNTVGGTYGKGGVINGPKEVTGCTFIGNGVFGDQISGACLYAGSSCLITNCVFDSNCNTGRWGEASAVYLTGNASIMDSVFTNNFWGSSGAKGTVYAGGTGHIVRCTFDDNAGPSSDGGAICGNLGNAPATIGYCKFRRNKNVGRYYGGAIAKFSGLITNCTFIGNEGYYGGAVYACSNIVDCVFTGNRSRSIEGNYNGGAGYKSVFFDCTVTNNSGAYLSGGFSYCSVYRSRSGVNTAEMSPGSHIVEADNTYFEDCELFGLRTFGMGYSKCAFNRCVIRDNIQESGHGYIFYNHTVVTNCLFIGNNSYRLLSSFTNSADGRPSEFINCTLISNKWDILAHRGDNTVAGFRVMNCLFHANKTRSWTSDDDVGEFYKGSVYSNNFISTTQPIVGDGNFNVKQNSSLKPSLMMARDPKHPFAPSRKSILNGAGLVEDWMHTAVDYAGNARLTDGRVSIGAYEWIEYYRGMTIIVR